MDPSGRPCRQSSKADAVESRVFEASGGAVAVQPAQARGCKSDLVLQPPPG